MLAADQLHSYVKVIPTSTWGTYAIPLPGMLVLVIFTWLTHRSIYIHQRLSGLFLCLFLLRLPSSLLICEIHMSRELISLC